MGEYVCDKCDFVFKTKRNLQRHIDNDSCKNKMYNCRACDKSFTTKNSMYRHMKHSCEIKKQLDQKEMMMNEMYSFLLSKIQSEKNVLTGDQIQEILEENKRLKEKVTSMEKRGKKTIINNINNGTVNNNVVNNNIVLVGYGKEDLSKVDHADLLKGMRMGFNSTLKLIDTVHFNPKYPEFHNVYISSMKNKYAMMYDGNDWTLVMKDELIDKLYDDKRNYIEENLDEFLNSLTISQQNALNRWLNVDDDHHYVKKIKNDIKLLLYNKRKLVTALKKNPCGLLDVIEDNNFSQDNDVSQKVIKTPKVSVTTISDDSDKNKLPCVMSKNTKSRTSPSKQPYSKRRAGKPGTKRKVCRRN